MVLNRYVLIRPVPSLGNLISEAINSLWFYVSLARNVLLSHTVAQVEKHVLNTRNLTSSVIFLVHRFLRFAGVFLSVKVIGLVPLHQQLSGRPTLRRPSDLYLRGSQPFVTDVLASLPHTSALCLLVALHSTQYVWLLSYHLRLRMSF